MSNPAVSICCITYNHEKYIRDALEGFLMQQTNFSFEILIHDDASTDGTTDIIREYEAKYPDIIKPIYQTENQYSKGKSIWCEFQFPRAQGKYIALCEGDDFWTDPHKLQIQYDFMESHPDYSLCMHNRNILNTIKKYYLKSSLPKIPTMESSYICKSVINCDFILFTQTIFFRKENYLKRQKEIERDSQGAPMRDAQLVFHLVSVGKFFFFNESMATYRIAKGSAMNWQDDNNVSLQFDKKIRLFLKKMAKNNGYSEWVNENKENKTKNTNQKISFLKMIAQRIYWTIKVAYGRFMFFLYHISSPQKRCKIQP